MRNYLVLVCIVFNSTCPRISPSQSLYINLLMATQQTIKDVTYFPKGTARYHYVHELENAGIAQIITRTLLAPLERWRLFSQTQASLNPGFIRYSNFQDFINGTIKTEGYKGLFRSNSANIWLYLTQVTAQHLYFDNINHSVDQMFEKGSYLETYGDNPTLKSILKVVAANFFTLLITYPIETARVRMALNTPNQSIKEAAFRGVYDTLRYSSLFNQKGIRNNTYRGFFFGNLTSLVYMSTYSACFSLANDPTIAERKEFSLFPITMMGSIPAILLTYPLDTIKHRLQLNSKNQGTLFNTTLAIKQVMKEPVSNLYKGLTASLSKHLLSAPIFFGLLNMKYRNGLNYF